MWMHQKQYLIVIIFFSCILFSFDNKLYIEFLPQNKIILSLFVQQRKLQCMLRLPEDKEAAMYRMLMTAQTSSIMTADLKKALQEEIDICVYEQKKRLKKNIYCLCLPLYALYMVPLVGIIWLLCQDGFFIYGDQIPIAAGIMFAWMYYGVQKLLDQQIVLEQGYEKYGELRLFFDTLYEKKYWQIEKIVYNK